MQINKKLIIGTIILATLSGYITFITTKNKYETKIVTKEIIKQDTSNTIAVYLEDEDGKHVYNGKNYRPSNELPTSGYKLNKSTSYCEVKNSEEELDKTQTNIEIDETANGITFSKVNKKGSKCYLYYDEIKEITGSSLAENPIKTLTTSAQFGVLEPKSGVTPAPGLYEFTGRDSKKTQFYRGAVTNNYVRLGKNSSNYTYWRIVRFDEEGNIRLIYDGTSAHDNGQQSDDRQITTNFNGTSMYTAAYHGTHAEANVKWSNSPIKTYLENTWMTAFEGRLSDKEKEQLTTGKFCSDTSVASTSGSNKYFGAYDRLETNKTPSFDCASGDLTTSRVGMLSADEWTFAGGGVYSETNISFYLYTGKNWWTLSPYYWYDSRAVVFAVTNSGSLNWNYGGVTNTYGVRPVIILDKNTVFDQNTNGTKNTPYTIV